MLAFRSDGSTGDVKKKKKNSLEFLDVRTSGRLVAVLLPGREGRGQRAVGTDAAVSLSVLLPPSHCRRKMYTAVRKHGRPCLLHGHCVPRQKCVCVCVCVTDHISNTNTSRGGLNSVSVCASLWELLFYQNRVRVEAAELANYTKACRWVFSH